MRIPFLAEKAAGFAFVLLAASTVMAAPAKKVQTTAPQVDYLQCEAMQKAKDRLSQSPAIRLQIAKAELAETVSMGPVSSNEREMRLLEARQRAIVALRAGQGDPEAVADMKKILKVQVDIEKAGCPN